MAGFTRRITAGEAVKNVLRAMSLPLPGVVSESGDPTAALMWFLATRAGQKLLDAFSWQFLVKEMLITTEAGVSTYALPADFGTFDLDSAWNRTTRLPAVGSLTQEEWQTLTAREEAGTTFTTLYRIANDMVELYGELTAGQVIALPYRSRAWASGTDGLSDNLSSDSDIVLYDRQLFEAALRYEWDTEKKFDTSASAMTYNMLLSAAKAKDKPARTLTMARHAGYPFIGIVNIPDTGYGSN